MSEVAGDEVRREKGKDQWLMRRLEVGKASEVKVRGGGRPVRWRLEVGKASEVEVRGGEGPWGGG